MGKARLETFSDGVIAILMTIMVLELHAPHDTTFAALARLLPTFLAYAMSFVYLGIYWNNHHHLLRAAGNIRGAVLWANHHLLFWLSLIPFATAWMGEDHTAALPTATYGCVLLGSALAFKWLQRQLIASEHGHSKIQAAIGTDWKGKTSVTLYTSAVPLAWIHTTLSHALFMAVAALWFIPDSRFEHVGDGDSY